MSDSSEAGKPVAANHQRRLYLRVSIKLLLAIGFVFLLLPFLKSLPWPTHDSPDAAALLGPAAIAPGETRQLLLADGSTVFVTRSSPELAARLRDFPEDLLWSPSAPGLADQEWFLLGNRNAVDEPVHFLPANGAWPGGFVADNGSAWDVAGRALKPWPGHPTGQAMTTQNLLPLPVRRQGDSIVLPAPPGTAAAPPE